MAWVQAIIMGYILNWEKPSKLPYCPYPTSNTFLFILTK